MNERAGGKAKMKDWNGSSVARETGCLVKCNIE